MGYSAGVVLLLLLLGDNGVAALAALQPDIIQVHGLVLFLHFLQLGRNTVCQETIP